MGDHCRWLPFVAAEYVTTTGDESILSESIPFLKGEVLRSDEGERYAGGFLVTLSKQLSNDLNAMLNSLLSCSGSKTGADVRDCPALPQEIEMEYVHSYSLVVLNNHLSVQAAADLSGYSPQYLRRLLRCRKLAGLKIGSVWLIDKDSIDGYLASAGEAHDQRYGPK